VIPETCSTHTHTHTHTDAYSLHTPRGGQCPPNQHQRLANNTHTGTQTHIQNTSRRPLLSKQHQRTASKHIHTKRHTRTHTHTPLGGHCPPNSTSLRQAITYTQKDTHTHTHPSRRPLPSKQHQLTASNHIHTKRHTHTHLSAATALQTAPAQPQIPMRSPKRHWKHLAVQHPVYVYACWLLYMRIHVCMCVGNGCI